MEELGVISAFKTLKRAIKGHALKKTFRFLLDQSIKSNVFGNLTSILGYLQFLDFPDKFKIV